MRKSHQFPCHYKQISRSLKRSLAHNDHTKKVCAKLKNFCLKKVKKGPKWAELKKKKELYFQNQN